MDEGLLWLDFSTKRDLAEKVARAADRYRLKFGRRANLCYVNPGTSQLTEPIELNGIRVIPDDSVLRHHFWIGVEEERELREVA